MRSTFTLLGLLVIACGSPQAPSGASDPEAPGPPEANRESPPPGPGPTLASAPRGHLLDGFWMTDGAPPPLACAADADCAYGGAVDGGGCCWSFRDMNAVAQSRAYASWLASYRARECASVACPSPPVPSQPPDCLFAVRCDTSSGAGVCVNACAP